MKFWEILTLDPVWFYSTVVALRFELLKNCEILNNFTTDLQLALL